MPPASSPVRLHVGSGHHPGGSSLLGSQVQSPEGGSRSGRGGRWLPTMQPRRKPPFQRKRATPGAQRASRLRPAGERTLPGGRRGFSEASRAAQDQDRPLSAEEEGGHTTSGRSGLALHSLPPEAGLATGRAVSRRTGRRCSAQLHPPHTSDLSPRPGTVHTAAPGRQGLPQGPDSQTTQTGTHGHAAPSTWAP